MHAWSKLPHLPYCKVGFLGLCLLYKPLPCSGKVVIYFSGALQCAWSFIWEVYATLIACEPGEGALYTRD